MKPTLFALGPIQVHAYGTMVALGVFLALPLMIRCAKINNFPKVNDVYDLVFISLAAGFLGARIFYVCQHAAWYREQPLKFFALWEGGLIFYGGVVGAVLALWVFAKSKEISIFRVLDFLFPYVALVHAFGRIGCFLNGCCYGIICRLPWAVSFPQAPDPVHPTQLYEMAFDFILFWILSNRYAHRNFTGEVTALYFLFYGIGRFVIEFWRSENPMLYFFTWQQWISLAFIFAACMGLKLAKSYSLKTESGGHGT